MNRDLMAKIAWLSLAVSIILLVLMWRKGKIWNAHLIWKVPASAILVLMIVLSLDSGIGIATQGDRSSHSVESKGGSTTPKRLFLLLYGFNGRGTSLLMALEKYLSPHGVVVAFEPSLKGYDDDQVADIALQKIEGYDEVTVYCESFSGMTFMKMLRKVSKLRVKGLVFNATPSRVGYVRILGSALKALNLPWFQGGPISTWGFRLDQKSKVGPLPTLGTKEDTPAIQADRASLTITGPMALDQLRVMANFDPPTLGEFTDRVENVRYISAPGKQDDMVETDASFAEIAEAFPGAIHHKMPWNPGEHTPTPRRAESVAKQILAAADIQ